MKLLILSFFCFSIYSKVINLKLYSVEIEYINTMDKKSSYNRFLKAYEKSGVFNFDISFTPMRRSFDAFLKDKRGCFFPYTKTDSAKLAKGIILSKPLGDVEIYAISAKSQGDFPGKDKLNDLSFATKSVYRESINSLSSRVFYAEKADQLFQMLKKNRVEYILESVPDVFLGFTNGQADFDKLYKYDRDKMVFLFRDYFACHDNSFGQKVIKELNELL